MADSRANGRRNGTREMRGREAIESVKRELPSLLGRPIESVLGLAREEDGGWTVAVEVVELARVPSSTDVLGLYAVSVDREGELTGYRRSRRYYRNQANEE
jgi:Gas vesicle synthesis protein GvpO